MRTCALLPWLVVVGIVVSMGCSPDPISLDDGADSDTSDATSGSPPPLDGTGEPQTTGIPPTTADVTTAGPPPIPEECDVLAQDCPEGYKCTYYYDEVADYYGAQRCVQVVPDPLGPLAPCTIPTWPPDGNDDCDATSFCFDVSSETLQGQCVAFCIEVPEGLGCSNPCDYCAISGSSDLLPCFPTCDPLIKSCPRGQGCYPVNEYFTCAPDGSEAGGGLGQPCEFINACRSGLACLNGEAVPGCEGIGCCAPFCDPSAAFDPCPKLLPGSACQPWYEEGQQPLSECGYDPPGVCAVL